MKHLVYGFLVIIMAWMPVPTTHAQEGEMDGFFDEEPEPPPPGVFNEAPIPPVPNLPPAGESLPTSNFPSSNTGSAPSFGGGGSGAGGRFPRVQSAKTPKIVTPPKTAPGTSASTKPSLANAQPEDITNENFPELIDSFDYPNAEITDVINAISQLTGKNFIVDKDVRGKITIIAPTQITVAEAYRAFLSALAANDFTVVPAGKFLKIKPSRKAQQDSIETYAGDYSPNTEQMITRIVHLKHISADEVNKNLRMLNSNMGTMLLYAPTNSLIITDYGSNIERIMRILNELDRAGFEEQLAVIPIRYAKAKDMADLIDQIINKTPRGAAAGQAGGFRPGVPTFRSRVPGGAGASGPEELSLVAPDERTNALVVVGNKSGIEKIRELVRKLDYKQDPSEYGGVNVYYVRYGEAEKIAQTLSGISGGGSGSSGGSPPGVGGPMGTFGGARPFVSPLEQRQLFGGDVKIVADKNTNSLVISASKQDYEIVKNLLSKIDVPRDQVFVEAVIMEMNSSKNRSWNLSYYSFNKDSKGIGRAGFAGSKVGSIIDVTSDRGAVLGFGKGETFKLTIPSTNKEIEIPSLLAFLNFLQDNSEGNVLSTPQVLALDNEEAMIEVGEKVPIGNETTRTAVGETTAPRFEDATIKLTIKPFISPDSEDVRMEIKQSVKQPTRATIENELAKTTTVISTRQINTNIVVGSGDTAVLGGLIRDQDQVSEAKVPILGDIPVLGWLFKSSEIKRSKVNLVVFLTPKIIRNMEDNHQVLGKVTSRRVEWIKNNFDGRDPYGKTIEELPRADASARPERTAPPKSNR